MRYRALHGRNFFGIIFIWKQSAKNHPLRKMRELAEIFRSAWLLWFFDRGLADRTKIFMDASLVDVLLCIGAADDRA